MTHLILASSSPRRKELLEQLHLTFDVIASNVDETVDFSLPPEKIVMELAKRKSADIAKDYPQSYCIGADTLVIYDGLVLGKPKNSDEAKDMLKLLSGKTHMVYTGTTIFHEKNETTFFEKAEVTFWDLSEKEIERYVETGEPLDKAGSYGIQGYGATLVKSIHGDFFSIVGLPIAKLHRTLQKMGYPL